jgi:hypothetical protein
VNGDITTIGIPGQLQAAMPDWCQARRLTLEQLHPIVIGGYIDISRR